MMNETSQIHPDELEVKAVKVLENNPSPRRGPRTLKGKMNALKNLKKRVPNPNSKSLASDIYYSSVYVSDTYKTSNITKAQNAYYQKRLKYLQQNTQSLNVLNEFVVKAIILSEIEIQKYFHFLNKPETSLKEKLKVQKLLKSTTENYIQYFKLLWPYQKKPQSVHYSMAEMMQDLVTKKGNEEEVKNRNLQNVSIQ